MKATDFAKNLRAWSKYPYSYQPEAVSATADKVFEAVGENFDRAEDASGAAWPEHSPVTIAMHGVHPLLILSRRLKNAATGGSEAVRRKSFANKRTVYGIGVSPSIPYWRVHQRGSSGPPRIPRRQYFYLNRRARPGVVAFLRQQVVKKIRKDTTWK